MNQGVTHEAMVFAVVQRLLAVFVCENSGGSEMTPISRVVPIQLIGKESGRLRLADRFDRR